MTQPSLEPGSMLDGFLIEDAIHRGGMATLFNVSRADNPMPMVMKIPRIGEGEDPAAIVSFEMEQMIMPRLTGVHVATFVAAGDFGAAQPYIVMERIAGEPLLARLPELPMPYGEAVAIAEKIAAALADLHRQHVIHHDIKPSNIMFRPTGEAVILDMGLACSDQLPDLMQEEFRLPFGTAPYMAPERLLGARDDPRSDLFALGVLLYFFTTGVRPFGETETMYGMRRRLWRDPVPPRKLKPDYPPWLQEIVLRCLEIEPAWRYPTAEQLSFDLAHPAQVKLTTRSERLKRDPLTTVLRRRFNKDLTRPRGKPTLAAHLASAPILAVAIDLSEGSPALNDELRTTAGRILATLPSARLACLNVLKLGRITIDKTLDEHGHNKHVDRLVALRHWAEPLKLEEHRLTVHVLEAIDPASAVLEFAEASRVNHILIGARRNSVLRKLLGSVSAKVAAEAACTVTVVRCNAAAGQMPADIVTEDADQPIHSG
ncbi:MAG: protein kinase [Rhodopseudomonas sp.]|uniref:bifunctional serine/threonine-protein kinase/universal stress protein n=1 Tax=Rhodopseudomonas sp. TaxID=1078 RepID=UPI001836907C|nr:bifunctional serine/threonine-protein kinase/universal stress protein [Rhodopseudomonas sp.]NVN88861.1 protein kinase [Rhodopseudomonas sp.]